MKALFMLCTLAASALAQGQNDAKKYNMAEMMERAKKFTQPGEAHKALEKFLGVWRVENSFVMGGKQTKPEIGEQRCDWLIKGRWVHCRLTGQLMGKPAESVTVIGYDNFKLSYRVMMVSSIDTAMNTSEGDMDPGGKVLLTYGTLDEYLTGEHDKMVKYVWRFETPDSITMEVHDLPIGEKNTQVLNVRYTRKP